MSVLNLRSAHLLVGLSAAVLLGACSKTETAATEEAPVVEAIDEAGMAAGEDVEPFDAGSGPSYLGVWAADETWCAAAPGASDASPIVITEGEFIGYENLCRIANVEELSENVWRMDLVCVAEGVEYIETINLTAESATLTLSRDDSSETVFLRCE